MIKNYFFSSIEHFTKVDLPGPFVYDRGAETQVPNSYSERFYATGYIAHLVTRITRLNRSRII